MKCCYVSFHVKNDGYFTAFAANQQLEELIECAVMTNSDEAHSVGQAGDRSCTDVERILHNDTYRRPFQVFLKENIKIYPHFIAYIFSES